MEENKMKNQKKINERGITMIALSLTIIVLSILAGVTINLGLTDNSSIVKEMRNETQLHEEMIKEEQRKTNSVIQKYEDEWGIG